MIDNPHAARQNLTQFRMEPEADFVYVQSRANFPGCVAATPGGDRGCPPTGCRSVQRGWGDSPIPPEYSVGQKA